MRKIKEFVKKVQPSKIWVVGDAMLDQYYNVKISRISPEFPTQVMLSSSEYPVVVKPGGAANVCYQMSHFPVDVTLFSPSDEETERTFSPLKFKHSFITEKEIVIPRKKRFYDEDYALPRWDVEVDNYGLENKKLKESIFKLFKNKLEQEKHPDVVILSDYGKGVFDDETAKLYIELCKEYNIKTIVDPKNNLNCWQGCTIFKPNLNEALRLTNLKSELNAICKIRDRLKCEAVVLTRSDQDPLYTDNKDWSVKLVQDPSIPNNTIIEKPRSVIGAGDCFVSMLAIAIANGFSYYEAANIAHQSGMLYVKNKKNKPLRTTNITGDKLISQNELADIIKEHKDEHKQIVFTNGCFDILHTGHIKLLKEAKKQGHILVVALNSDSSIKQIKGKDRPINTLENRIQILKEFECVDYITSFEEKDPLKLIKKIKTIDVLVKGGDYKADEVIGSGIAKRTHIVNLLPNMSTTNIINKIK